MSASKGTLRISEVTNLRSGYPFRGRVEPALGGGHRVIQIRDVHEQQRLQTDQLDSVNLASNVDRYLVRIGDVLFLSRGHRQYAVPIEIELERTIASGYFYILTPDPDRLIGGYLAWYINQPVMQARLRGLARGSHMPFVAMQEFGDLQMPVPSFDVQRRIVVLAELQDREHRLSAALANRRDQLIETTTLSAIRRDTHKDSA